MTNILEVYRWSTLLVAGFWTIDQLKSEKGILKLNNIKGVIPKTRVLLVSAVSDFKGGAEIVMRNMMSSPFVEFVLAVPHEGPFSEMARGAGIPVCFYRPTALLMVHRPPNIKSVAAAIVDTFRCAYRLRSFLREHRCDLVHTNGLKPHALNALLSLIWRVPTVIHMHDIPYSWRERVIWRVLAACVTRMILVSRPCYPGATLPKHVTVIPNGIILPNIILAPKTSIPAPLRFGFVGRFHPNKGMDLLLDWVKAMLQVKSDITLTLRGRPDPDMPEYWDHIQQRIKVEGLSEIVTHEGWLDQRALYDGLDVLMVPSHRPDPGPLVVTEAMSAGVIVIGYPAGGIPFAINDGESGLLVEDTAQIGPRLTKLIATEGAFERMRQNAHARVVEMCNIEKFHVAINDMYAVMP